MNIRWTIGDLVRKLRGERTQEDVADKAGINKATIVRLEINSDRAEMATITRVAEALGTTAHDLGLYVEALNRANQIAQLGPKGRDAVRRYLEARLTPRSEPVEVPGPTRELSARPTTTATEGRGVKKKSRGA